MLSEQEWREEKRQRNLAKGKRSAWEAMLALIAIALAVTYVSGYAHGSDAAAKECSSREEVTSKA